MFGITRGSAALFVVLAVLGSLIGLPPAAADPGSCPDFGGRCTDLLVSFANVPSALLPFGLQKTFGVTVSNPVQTESVPLDGGAPLLKVHFSAPVSVDDVATPAGFVCGPSTTSANSTTCGPSTAAAIGPGQDLVFTFTVHASAPTPQQVVMTAMIDARDQPTLHTATALAQVPVWWSAGVFGDFIGIVCDRPLPDERVGTAVVCKGLLFVRPNIPIPALSIPVGGGLGLEDPEGFRVDSIRPAPGFSCISTGCMATAPLALKPGQATEVFVVSGVVTGVLRSDGELLIDMNLCTIGTHIFHIDCIGIGGSVSPN
jgi:hypothetical protein